MKKKKRKIEAVILAIVFVAAVIIFSFLTNRGDENTTVGLDGASCPQVSFEMGGYQMNQLEGYVKEMDVTVLRDTITPVIYNQVTAVIDAHDAEITGIDYAVYSLDGKEKLYEDTISKPQEEVKLEFSGEDLLEDEKVLKLTLHVGEEKEIYYYTRIVDASDANLKICLDYANDFHTNALQKLEDQGVETAIETTANGYRLNPQLDVLTDLQQFEGKTGATGHREGSLEDKRTEKFLYLSGIRISGGR